MYTTIRRYNGMIMIICIKNEQITVVKIKSKSKNIFLIFIINVFLN